MSFVSLRIRHLDQQLERLLPAQAPPTRPATPAESVVAESVIATPTRADYARNLRNVIRALDGYSSGNRRISPETLLSLIRESEIGIKTAGGHAEASAEEEDGLEKELEWVFIGKLAIQTYAVVLETLLSQTLPLSEDLRFWNEVRASYRWTMVYWIQTSPLRLAKFTKEIAADSLKGLQELKNETERQTGRLREFLTPEFRSTTPPIKDEEVPEISIGEDAVKQEAESKPKKEKRKRSKESDKPVPALVRDNFWKFYHLVRKTIEDRSREFQRTALVQTPFALARREIRDKEAAVKHLREMQATALGILVGEGLVFDLADGKEDWKGMVERTVVLMENITRNVFAAESSVEDFEEVAFSVEPVAFTEKGYEAVAVAREGMAATTILSLQLQDILQKHLPMQAQAAHDVVALHGRPSWIIRNWVPLTGLILSSSTILRYLFNREAEIKQWIRELGETAVDFWANWVVDPLKRIIGTIRHDEGSEVALMSRKSLAADMESLERMVVDFAIDNPQVSLPVGEPPAQTLSPQQLDLIRDHVKEGDLTPVLRAYEQDLRKPFVGAIKGELVRALLIQIQKTKVDVEVAISGIDSLLKSQELLFGIMGLMPSTLICVGTLRWFRGTWGGRRGFKVSKLGQEMLRSLRNIDRILTSADPDANQGLLSFKDHGLVLCEIYLLQEYAKSVLPKDVLGDFTEEMEDLADIRKKIRRQRKIVKRVRWAFAKWIH